MIEYHTVSRGYRLTVEELDELGSKNWQLVGFAVTITLPWYDYVFSRAVQPDHLLLEDAEPLSPRSVAANTTPA